MYSNLCTALASNNAVSDPAGARRLGRASLGMSTAGVIATVIIVVAVVAVTLSCSGYMINGSCYKHRSYSYSYRCSTYPVRSGDYCYYNWSLAGDQMHQPLHRGRYPTRDLQSLDFTVNRFFTKLFSTKDNYVSCEVLSGNV